jgi:hypothetical protein
MPIRFENQPVGAGGLAAYAVGSGKVRERALERTMTIYRDVWARRARREEQIQQQRWMDRRDQARDAQQYSLEVSRNRFALERDKARDQQAMEMQQFRGQQETDQKLMEEWLEGRWQLSPEAEEDLREAQKAQYQAGDPKNGMREGQDTLVPDPSSVISRVLRSGHKMPTEEYENNGWVMRNTKDGPVRVRPLDEQAEIARTIIPYTPTPGGPTQYLQPKVDRYGNRIPGYETIDFGDTPVKKQQEAQKQQQAQYNWEAKIWETKRKGILGELKEYSPETAEYKTARAAAEAKWGMTLDTPMPQVPKQPVQYQPVTPSWSGGGGNLASAGASQPQMQIERVTPTAGVAPVPLPGGDWGGQIFTPAASPGTPSVAPTSPAAPPVGDWQSSTVNSPEPPEVQGARKIMGMSEYHGGWNGPQNESTPEMRREATAILKEWETSGSTPSLKRRKAEVDAFNSTLPKFTTEAEASAAVDAGQIRSGDYIFINGRKKRVP